MEEKIRFTRRKLWKEKIMDAKSQKNSVTFNFINSHDLYFFSKSPLFRESIKGNINFIDGFIISVFLSLSNKRRISRFSGTEFMRSFFNNEEISKGKHLFIGSKEKDIKILIKKFPHLKQKDLFYYNPPYIKEMEFPDREIEKISRIIKLKKIDYVWIGLGCPKQNFLSYYLVKKVKQKNIIFFNIGAAMDFVLERKKKAPRIFLKIGIEWLYRLITDFNHSKKKVWRSFVSLLYLNKIKLTK